MRKLPPLMLITCLAIVAIAALWIVVGPGLTQLAKRVRSAGLPRTDRQLEKMVAKTVIFTDPTDTKTLSLDIVEPNSNSASRQAPGADDASQTYPAILFLHGGDWVSGGRQDVEQLAKFAALNGFVAATADYRLAPTNPWPAQLDDARLAVRYLQSNAGALHIDADRIAAIGINSGAQIAVFLGSADPSAPSKRPNFGRVQAIGGIDGIYDLNLPLTPKGENAKIVQALVGSRNGSDVGAASPIHIFPNEAAPTTASTKGPVCAPCYFLYGDSDPLLPSTPHNQDQPIQTEVLASAIAAFNAKNPDQKVPYVKENPIAGLGDSINLEDLDQHAAFVRMLRWIQTTLQDVHPLPLKELSPGHKSPK